jgi:GR25 family glycosyltransferase involved in LPS biosynthesis
MVTWNDIKIADKGFLINLKERSDRLEDSLSELNKVGISGVERFDAIRIEEDSDKGWKIRGCTHSHIELLKLQVTNRWDRILILEDDFELDICSSIPFEITDGTINQISNAEFDLLFLGATLLEDSEKFNEFLIKPKSFVQTTSYISSLKMSEFVVKNFNYLDKESMVSGEQIDTFYSTLSSKKHWRMCYTYKDSDVLLNHDLKIFFHFPIIFNQRRSFSDILNMDTYYGNINKIKNLKNYPN